MDACRFYHLLWWWRNIQLGSLEKELNLGWSWWTNDKTRKKKKKSQHTTHQTRSGDFFFFVMKPRERDHLGVFFCKLAKGPLNLQGPSEEDKMFRWNVTNDASHIGQFLEPLAERDQDQADRGWKIPLRQPNVYHVTGRIGAWRICLSRPGRIDISTHDVKEG